MSNNTPKSIATAVTNYTSGMKSEALGLGLVGYGGASWIWDIPIEPGLILIVAGLVAMTMRAGIKKAERAANGNNKPAPTPTVTHP